MYVEISRGRSFKGLAQYCLHDVDRKGDNRVAFVETRNLGTDNPQLAWRIMTARHYLQDELKAKAGVGNGGAKDGKPVGHLLISWKKEEAQAEQLTHLGMVNAAHGALRAIEASQHQAIIIGHTDTPHPHCHVIINLIGDDGRLKKNWNERKKLSKFALKRELEIHGEAIVKKRQKNWLDREAGESPEPVKKKPRHLYELDKAARKCPETKRFAEQHHNQVQQLQRSKVDSTTRHQQHQAKLKWCLQERNRRTQMETDKKIRASRTAVRKAYRPRWDGLLDQQARQRRAFEENERNLKGSLANAMQLIDWKQVLRRKRQPDQLRLGDAFRILTSEATRREKLNKQQQAEQNQLRAKQRQEEQAEERQLQQEQTSLLRQQRRDYLRKAAAMKQRQARSCERLKADQQALTRERNAALRKFRELEQQRRLKKLDGITLSENHRQQAKPQIDSPQKQEQLNPAVETPPKQTVPFQKDAQTQQEKKPTRVRRERKPRTPRPPRQTLAVKPEQSPPPSEADSANIPKEANELHNAPTPEMDKPPVRRADDFEKRMRERLKTRWQRGHDRDRSR